MLSGLPLRFLNRGQTLKVQPGRPRRQKPQKSLGKAGSSSTARGAPPGAPRPLPPSGGAVPPVPPQQTASGAGLTGAGAGRPAGVRAAGPCLEPPSPRTRARNPPSAAPAPAPAPLRQDGARPARPSPRGAAGPSAPLAREAAATAAPHLSPWRPAGLRLSPGHKMAAGTAAAGSSAEIRPAARWEGAAVARQRAGPRLPAGKREGLGPGGGAASGPSVTRGRERERRRPRRPPSCPLGSGPGAACALSAGSGNRRAGAAAPVKGVPRGNSHSTLWNAW